MPKLERQTAKQWVEENPNEAYQYDEPTHIPEKFGAPPTFMGDFETGVGELTVAQKRIGHREALQNSLILTPC